MTDQQRHTIARYALVNGVRHQPRASCTGNLSGFAFARKVPDVHLFPGDSDSSTPAPARLDKGYAAITRRRRLRARNVLHILGLSRPSKIRSPAVQTITVDMIDADTVPVSKPQQLPMQEYGYPVPINDTMTSCIKHMQPPAPLVGPLGIGSVDYRVGANRAVATAQSNPRGCTTDTFDRTALAAPVACARPTAVHAPAALDRVVAGKEFRAALNTFARRATILRHRDHSSVSRPRAVTTGRGHSAAQIIPPTRRTA